MSASNITESRKNFYNIAFGYLSTSIKDKPEGKEEITIDKLKAMQKNCENIDLRNLYVKKSGDYPYKIFYQKIEGEIESIGVKDTEEYGKFLEIKIRDSDLENSVVQCKLYSKYSEDFLNRFLADFQGTVSIRPYSIPSDFADESGKVIRFNNQGVAIYKEGKIEKTIRSKDLPPKDEYVDGEGKSRTTNRSRVEFLLQKAKEKLDVGKKQTPKIEEYDIPNLDTEDDLPF